MSENTPQPLPPDDPWAEGTWEGHEIAQLRRMAALPFREKLIWLEQMQRIQEHIKKKRREMGLPVMEEEA